MRIPYDHISRFLKRTNLVTFVIGLVLIFVAIENLYSETFKHCVKYYSARETPYYRRYKYPVIVEIADTKAVCTIAEIDRHPTFFELLLSLALVFFTYRLSTSTSKMMEATAAQGAATKESISQASRAADAMEGVAKSLAINAEQIVTTVKINKEIADRQKLFGEMQMRAYVSVLMGGGTYQEREKSIKFEGKVRFINIGSTVARKLSYTCRSAILPFPLPIDHVLPEGDTMFGGPLAPRADAESLG